MGDASNWTSPIIGDPTKKKKEKPKKYPAPKTTRGPEIRKRPKKFSRSGKV
jgi:hypothetical protein